MPRRTRWRMPEEPDYSPTEVAELGLLGIGRAAIYRQIRRGEIQVIKDDGYERITLSEIERLRRLRNIKTIMKARDRSPELEAEIKEIKHQIQVDAGREGGKRRAALHSKEEIAHWYGDAKRQKWTEEIDPHHTMPQPELERRLEDMAQAQLAAARRQGHQQRLLRKLQQPQNHV